MQGRNVQHYLAVTIGILSSVLVLTELDVKNGFRAVPWQIGNVRRVLTVADLKNLNSASWVAL